MALVRLNVSGDDFVAMPDDDFGWSTVAIAAAVAVAAVGTPTAALVQQQYAAAGQDEIPSVPPVVDEDFWQNPVQPNPGSLFRILPLGDPEELPAGSLYGQPDEDFWQNPVAPVQASFYQPLPLGDPEELPAGSLFGQPDEDYWYHQIRHPSYERSYAARSIGGSGHNTLDEYYWQNPVRPVVQSFYQPLPYLPDPDETPQLFIVVPLNPDEDFWQNPVAPVQASFYQRLPIRPDPEEIPAGNLVAQFPGPPEEDFWLIPKGSTSWALWPQPIFGDVDAVIAGPDENYLLILSSTPASLQSYLPIDGDYVGISTGSADEDYWWAAPVRPSFQPYFAWLPRDEPQTVLVSNVVIPPQPILLTGVQDASNISGLQERSALSGVRDASNISGLQERSALSVVQDATTLSGRQG